jgi:hypothetical protein
VNFPSFARRLGGAVVNQVQAAGIATDPNNRGEYRGPMPEDAGADDTGADVVLPAAATPADIIAGEAAQQPATSPPSVSSLGSASPFPTATADTGYTAGGVPTFDYAREKIETRYGTAIGSAELAAETPEGRTVEEQYDARQKAAADRLAQIRESMRADKPNDS